MDGRYTGDDLGHKRAESGLHIVYCRVQLLETGVVLLHVYLDATCADFQHMKLFALADGV